MLRQKQTFDFLYVIVAEETFQLFVAIVLNKPLAMEWYGNFTWLNAWAYSLKIFNEIIFLCLNMNLFYNKFPLNGLFQLYEISLELHVSYKRRYTLYIKNIINGESNAS